MCLHCHITGLLPKSIWDTNQGAKTPVAGAGVGSGKPESEVLVDSQLQSMEEKSALEIHEPECASHSIEKYLSGSYYVPKSELSASGSVNKTNKVPHGKRKTVNRTISWCD